MASAAVVAGSRTGFASGAGEDIRLGSRGLHGCQRRFVLARPKLSLHHIARLMSETTTAARAVFLSYAREDAEMARRLADTLRAFGVEVWFDQNELRGGDVWDA